MPIPPLRSTLRSTTSSTSATEPRFPRSGNEELHRIATLTAYCREHGILRLKSGDIELELSPVGGPVSESERQTVSEALGDTLTGEDMLFYSAPQMAPVPADESE